MSQEQIDQIVDRLKDPFVDRLKDPLLEKLPKLVFWRIVKNVHWWIAFLLFWGVVIWGSNKTIKGALENLIISRIDQEFKEERIQKHIQVAVSTRATEMLTNEIQPEVSRVKGEVTRRVDDFQVFLDTLKADYQRDYQTLSKEISQLQPAISSLKTTTDFYLLLARATNDDRNAFEILVEISNKPGTFQEIASNAVSTIILDIDPTLNVHFLPEVPWSRYHLDPQAASL